MENIYNDITKLQYDEQYKIYSKLKELLKSNNASYKHEWYEQNKKDLWHCEYCDKSISYFAKALHLKGKTHKLIVSKTKNDNENVNEDDVKTPKRKYIKKIKNNNNVQISQ